MTAEPRPAYDFVSADLTRAAEKSGLSISELQKAIKDGDLVAHYRGRKPLIRADELDAWVASLPNTPHRRTA